MPFKPFAHLARVSLAKGIAHTYAPSVVAAGQSLGQFQNYPVAKFTKTAQLQQVFSGPSGSGAGAKAGHGSQSGSDAGLAQYYAAWQHAQQTGDDSDWKRHEFARTIGWKHEDRLLSSKHAPQRATDSLVSVSRLTASRVNSDRLLPQTEDVNDALAEAEALAKVDEAIAQEIQDVKASAAVEENTSREDEVGTPAPSTRISTPVPQETEAAQTESSSSSQQLVTPPTEVTSVASDESLLSEQIVELGQQQRYTEIPAIFEAIIKEGLVPTIDAYNHILLSAIRLSHSYQPWPRALEVYGDMIKRAVELNATTYYILLHFLVGRSLEAYQVRKTLGGRAARYGSEGALVLPSATSQLQLYSADTSLTFATKLYNIARVTLDDFRLPAPLYNALVKACAQNGLVDAMNILLTDMESHQIALDTRLYTAVIDAQASKQDIHAAQSLYEQYRDLAISRSANDPLDMQVYASLIKAYYACGLADTGIRFYEKILQSFKGSSNEQVLSEHLTSAFILNGVVQHHIDNKEFSSAMASVKGYALQPTVRDQAFSTIAVAAADADVATDALSAYEAVNVNNLNSETVMALVSMHVRGRNVSSAIEAWTKARSLPLIPTTDFTTMYALTLIGNGLVEEGIAEAREMFQRIRSSCATPASSHLAGAEIDEAIVLFGEALSKQQAIVSAPTSVSLLRAMIENGGLVSPVAQHAIASLGPDCVHQLNAQDIALALHVQAQMLATGGSADIAHHARFSHLLETVLNRAILMDPSTVHIVTQSLPKLADTRPDLIQRWQEFVHPSPPASVHVQAQSPLTPHSVAADTIAPADSFDPYAHNTDYRASKAISDLVESTTGRLENHISDSLGRLRNVRRAGRHLHYSGYSKLITAAGKAKQANQVHEILSMAHADVPMALQIPSVRSGWISILDAMVAACLTVGQREQATKFHQDLLEMGAAPSANTFGIYITTLEGTFDEATEAVKIFQRALSEGVTPSVFLYNAVIGKLGKARRIDDCLRYFGDMEGRGIRPSSVTYGTLVNALCRTSEERFAVDMFDEMEAAPNYRPRPAPYNSIIQYFLNTKRDRTKVLEYYERMKSKSIKPTSHTYKLLIEAYASLEPVNLGAAESLLTEMRQSGIQPEAVHYGSLIHAKGCVLHDMEGARALFESVVTEGAIRPTDTLYQNLLESMVANHEVTRTPEVVEDMKRHGISMTPYIANTLIHGWTSEGNIANAKSVYDSIGMAKREPSTYEAMTRAFLSGEDRIGANAVVQEMMRKGYPSAVTEKVLALIGGITV